MSWSIAKSRATYGISRWGAGYFDVNDAGHVVVRPRHAAGQALDIHELVASLQRSGLSLPVLVRFPDILQSRVNDLCHAFATHIQRENYKNRYTALYPIKVNQQEAVIKSIIATPNVSIGLEAGSKPELMIVLALAPHGSTICCNGYKDREFIRLALIGQKLGHQVFIVIEKESEVALVIDEARKLNMLPNIGLRVRLSSLSSSKWSDTGGDKAKFGLSAEQLLSVVQQWTDAGMRNALRLLHFHMGSQIANLDDYRQGFQEAIRYYAELRALQCPIDFIDVGGGLGIDYDGTHSRQSSSVNYDMYDYAGCIVGLLGSFCNQHGLPHPHIMSESGRAMTAHHAVLIVQVTDSEQRLNIMPQAQHLASMPELIQRLCALDPQADDETATETYYRATHYMQELAGEFAEGRINLTQKAWAEQYYFALCHALQSRLHAMQRSHRDVFDALNDKLADKYICNFSIFQSLPDTWAIDQVLPVMPIHRLDEQPNRRAVLQDLTCDSDGKIRQYIDTHSIESSLAVHSLRENEEYLLGIFLVGAYQEILGDMHNLFGDTDSVNVYLDADGNIRIEGIESHDTIEDLLRYVHLEPAELMSRFRDKVAGSALADDERSVFLDALRLGLTRSSYLTP